ncbi:hypothetical protein GCM10023149_28880 [Mucilaginibacter gynuensis]|uniref:Uncharacterized protein n=1 Tax=Mucilaginibacter gynuensis TaxID=1302236 RepID=A0ABP8GKT3_9SPHI
MKKLSIRFALAAAILGIGSAYAGNANHFAVKKWGLDRSTGLYVDVTTASPSTYSCTGSSGVCTATYDSDVNPNNQAGDTHPGTADPITIVNGTFAN